MCRKTVAAMFAVERCMHTAPSNRINRLIHTDVPCAGSERQNVIAIFQDVDFVSKQR